MTESDNGFFGRFGGRYVAEILRRPIEELEEAFNTCMKDPSFLKELEEIRADFIGRPTPLYHAKRLSEQLGGAQIFVKLEGLANTGAHKINNAIGQALVAKRMGKTRIIAETGAGQHGVATAAACAKLGLKCRIYMGEVDVRRQQPNVATMEMYGAEVVAVTSGSRILKDAINDAMRDWATNFKDTHYLIGSALGPSPFPDMVRTFQSVIGREVQQQMAEKGRKIDAMVACVGGGSNAIGLFHPYIEEKSVRLVGVEAGGLGVETLDKHAAPISSNSPVGVLHGFKSYLMQDENGQVSATHSVSAGLDYPGVGPEHAYLHKIGRVEYTAVNDKAALSAFHDLCRYEGIIPALESSHALAWAIENAPKMSKDKVILVNLSGRGDKDINTVAKLSGIEL